MAKKWAIWIGVLGLGGGLAVVAWTQLRQFQGRPIQQWVRDLASDDFPLRERASVALQQMGPAAVPFLIQAVRSPSPAPSSTSRTRSHWLNRFVRLFRAPPENVTELRERAGDQLATIGRTLPGVAERLVEALDDAEPAIGAEVQRALRRIGSPSVPALAAALRRPNPRISAGAAQIIRDLGPEARSAVPALCGALREQPERVREEIIEALGACAALEPEVARVLTRALLDSSRSIRSAAADALGRLRATSAILALHRALSDPEPPVRVAAARALWRIEQAPEPLVPVLIVALRTPETSWQAALLLGELGPSARDAVPALMGKLRQEQVPRPMRTPPVSSIALGRIGAPAVPELINALGDGPSRVRAAAAIALGFIGPTAVAAIPGLTRCLRDPDLEVRQAAALSLAGIGPETVELRPALAELTRDDDVFISSAAASLLQRIEPGSPLPGE